MPKKIARNNQVVDEMLRLAAEDPGELMLPFPENKAIIMQKALLTNLNQGTRDLIEMYSNLLDRHGESVLSTI